MNIIAARTFTVVDCLKLKIFLALVLSSNLDSGPSIYSSKS